MCKLDLLWKFVCACVVYLQRCVIWKKYIYIYKCVYLPLAANLLPVLLLCRRCWRASTHTHDYLCTPYLTCKLQPCRRVGGASGDTIANCYQWPMPQSLHISTAEADRYKRNQRMRWLGPRVAHFFGEHAACIPVGYLRRGRGPTSHSNPLEAALTANLCVMSPWHRPPEQCDVTAATWHHRGHVLKREDS